MPAIAHFLEPQPEVRIRHGRINRKAMKREMIAVEELEAKLREQGIDSITDVCVARLESDGKLSVKQRAERPESENSKEPKAPDDTGPPGG
ncbi:YetF domain-containing protein [Variovorax sp. ZT4R33]|uniref:YetF domain-containing protein n=1 Tax=Variovorax sp. ZT4R33 TaxID=3443743 RepID=UPI003F483321